MDILNTLANWNSVSLDVIQSCKASVGKHLESRYPEDNFDDIVCASTCDKLVVFAHAKDDWTVQVAKEEHAWIVHIDAHGAWGGVEYTKDNMMRHAVKGRRALVVNTVVGQVSVVEPDGRIQLRDETMQALHPSTAAAISVLCAREAVESWMQNEAEALDRVVVLSIKGTDVMDIRLIREALQEASCSQDVYHADGEVTCDLCGTPITDPHTGNILRDADDTVASPPFYHWGGSRDCCHRHPDVIAQGIKLLSFDPVCGDMRMNPIATW